MWGDLQSQSHYSKKIAYLSNFVVRFLAPAGMKLRAKIQGCQNDYNFYIKLSKNLLSKENQMSFHLLGFVYLWKIKNRKMSLFWCQHNFSMYSCWCFSDCSIWHTVQLIQKGESWNVSLSLSLSVYTYKHFTTDVLPCTAFVKHLLPMLQKETFLSFSSF